MRYLIVPLAAAFWAAFLLPANAVALQPPVKYDRPFRGKLYAVQHDFWGLLRECGWTVGCAPIGGDRRGVCIMHIAKVGTVMPGFKRVDAAEQRSIIRHERGHCNGWAANHAGGRYVR